MPTYDYLCTRCEKEFEGWAKIAERRDTKCTCGGSVEIMFKPARRAVVTFTPGWWNDIADKPVYCETPQELRDACDKNDAYSPYLQGSLWKTRESYRRGDPGVQDGGRVNRD